MKAEIITCHYDRFSVKIDGIIKYMGCMTKKKANEIIDKFNSALSEHVKSELSLKIEQVEKELNNDAVLTWLNEHRESFPNTYEYMVALKMRDEIIKMLKS